MLTRRTGEIEPPADVVPQPCHVMQRQLLIFFRIYIQGVSKLSLDRKSMLHNFDGQQGRTEILQRGWGWRLRGDGKY